MAISNNFKCVKIIKLISRLHNYNYNQRVRKRDNMPSLGKIKSVDLDNPSKLAPQYQQTKSTRFLPANDRSFIGALKCNHKEIIFLYKQVLETARNRDYLALKLMLGEFTAFHTNHTQMEDEMLNRYQKTLASKKSSIERRIVANFSSEMKNISNSICSTVHQSSNIPFNDKNIDAFIKGFSQMGFILRDLIDREERVLYPIYENSRKVVNIS